MLRTYALLWQMVLLQAVCPKEEYLGKDQAHRCPGLNHDNRLKPGLHMRVGQSPTELPPADFSLNTCMLSATTRTRSWRTARHQGAVCPVTMSPQEYPMGQTDSLLAAMQEPVTLCPIYTAFECLQFVRATNLPA